VRGEGTGTRGGIPALGVSSNNTTGGLSDRGVAATGVLAADATRTIRSARIVDFFFGARRERGFRRCFGVGDATRR